MINSTYKKVQEDIANRAVNTFHITVENGLISELSEWVQLVNNLCDKIGAAESTRITAHDTQNRLVSLQQEYQDKKSKKQGLFGGSKEQDLEGLQQKIAEAKDAQKSLSSEYQKSRNNIAQQVKQLMEKRYRYFDRIYVQMLECQAEYFQHCAIQSKRFQRDIDYYRKQYPKTNDFATSNGGIDGDNNIPNGDNGFPSRKRSVNSDDSKSNKKDQIQSQSHSNGNRSPRKTVPKQPAPTQVQAQMQLSQPSTASTTTTQSSQSSSNPTTSSSSPIMAGNKNGGKSKSSPPSRPNANGSHHDDFLNLSGNNNNNKQQRPPISKQESLLGMSHIFGSSGNNGAVSNEHDDLLKLGSSNHNDLLGMNNADNYNNGNNNGNNYGNNGNNNTHVRGQHSQSTSALGNPQTSHSITQNEDDIFGDFFGASNPATPQQSGLGQRSSHQPTNSTLDWFENGDKPQQKKQTSQSSQSLQQGMMAEFNKPSYGGGHGQQNGSRPKPNPPQSATSSTPVNGAQNADLSHEDKVKMVNMKLSQKGQDAANAAYKKAMDDRKKKEDEAEMELKQKEYFKNKHEQVLNNWEFDNTVRRNIRTLIGKLGDVLSLGDVQISWKPIPMTKLLNDAQLKKGYYKAVRVVHPDKSQGRGDSIENQVECLVFCVICSFYIQIMTTQIRQFFFFVFNIYTGDM